MIAKNQVDEMCIARLITMIAGNQVGEMCMARSSHYDS